MFIIKSVYSETDKIDAIRQRILKEEIKLVRFEQTDMFGISRSKVIPARHFERKLRGLHFILGTLATDSMGEYVMGTGYNEEIGQADAVTVPDLETFEVLPWQRKTARILIEPTLEGKPVAAHPRVIARKQLDKLSALGYSLFSAHELEFYVVNVDTMEPTSNDSNSAATIRLYDTGHFLNQLAEDLPQVGIDIECIETEYGPGQHEVTFRPSFGMKAADTAFTFRGAVKEIAKQHGLMASFMSKPYPDKGASSCHFCHSLWDVNGKIGLMFDSNSPDKLTDVARYWIAGILHHTPALSLMMGPTINCRTCYKPFSYVPMNATWGFDNRTCAIRVKINGESGSFFENRLGVAAANPYLALAGTVAAGIDGIKKKLPLPSDVKGSAYNLSHDMSDKTAIIPNTMEDAIEAFLQDEVMMEAFGTEFIKCFVAIKEHEIKKAKEAEAKGDAKWQWNTYFKYI